MTSRQTTKNAIAQAMKALMRDRSFRDITVHDITQASGVSHKTFYYHFCDKYDVVNWIFRTEVMEDILAHTTLEHWEDGSTVLCEHIRENPDFYMNAIKVEGQNSLREYLHLLTESQVNVLCRQADGGKKLPQDKFDFLVDFYYGAFIELFTTWLQTGMKETTDELVARWKVLVDKSLENYLKTYAG
jgi:probable dihydroxyacetone kinase regulator